MTVSSVDLANAEGNKMVLLGLIDGLRILGAVLVIATRASFQGMTRELGKLAAGPTLYSTDISASLE